MKIDHIAIYVKDLDKARWFFEFYFGARSNDKYQNPTTDFSSYFLSFDDGSRLEIMNKPGIREKNTASVTYGYVHLAFSAGSRENVDILTEKLRDASYKVISGPRYTGDGYYESCVEGIEGNLIEITE